MSESDICFVKGGCVLSLSVPRANEGPRVDLKVICDSQRLHAIRPGKARKSTRRETWVCLRWTDEGSRTAAEGEAAAATVAMKTARGPNPAQFQRRVRREENMFGHGWGVCGIDPLVGLLVRQAWAGPDGYRSRTKTEETFTCLYSVPMILTSQDKLLVGRRSTPTNSRLSFCRRRKTLTRRRATNALLSETQRTHNSRKLPHATFGGGYRSFNSGYPDLTLSGT